MTSLREKMADFGFESNDDYAFQVNCLLKGSFSGIRCLDIQGDSKRRKTAFATALADAMEFPHVIYHDFSERRPPPPGVTLPSSKDELGRSQPAIQPIDQRFAEACGLSEGEGTILILDQIQAADFREHIRLYQFVTSYEWTFLNATHHANPKYLLLFLISEEPLYHSLQKNSFRVWVGAVSNRQIPYQPEDFGLDEDIRPVMEELAELFRTLGMSPTHSEYASILADIHRRARSREELRHSIYGWMEGVDRTTLFSEETAPLLDATLDAVHRYLGLDEVELTALPEEPE